MIQGNHHTTQHLKPQWESVQVCQYLSIMMEIDLMEEDMEIDLMPENIDVEM